MEWMETKDLNFHYEKGKPVISQINLKIFQNEMTALTGPNGSGKTTLGKLLMGILSPVSGDVFLDDKRVSQMSLGQIGMTIGYLFQNPEKQFFAPTVEDEISFILRAKGLDERDIKSKVDPLLEGFELSHLREDFPLRLSQGEKQRLALAAILVNDLDYLILDEPTTGLDKERKIILADILNNLYNRGIGMIIISHDFEFLNQFPRRVLEINRGEIINDRKA